MTDQPELADRLRALLRADRHRMNLLSAVRDLSLPDCWIAAGFVRSAVWDHLVGAPPTRPKTDVDVVWFDGSRAEDHVDRKIERGLRARAGETSWSVKNQCRMHTRNGDAPYISATDAMRYWPETATAVAVRLNDRAEIDIAAPFGLDDLFQAIVRPTPRFLIEKRAVFEARIKGKAWEAQWPILQINAE